MDVTNTPAMRPLLVSVSPHIRDRETTGRIIWSVNAALLPAAIMGSYYFGLRAVGVIFLCIATAVAGEFLYQKWLKKKVTISDGSAVLTGLLLALNLPASVPFYIPILGSLFAIILTKQLFGGLGFNIFNPALMGRAFLLISFPKILTSWVKPVASFTGLDATTTATPLNIAKMEGMQHLVDMFGSKWNLYHQLIMGNRGGCIGETCIIALLVGAVFLLVRGYISWHIPVAYLGTVALLAWIFGNNAALFTGDPIMHLLSGGLILGAFFMATDYVTSPAMRAGQLVFGIGCGIITILIRLKGGYPEGVMFSILLMNCFAPLLDRGFRNKTFGLRKAVKK